MTGNKFNFSTVSEFDNHISSSVPAYDNLHALIVNIADHAISSKDSTFIDIGCTTGKLVKDIKERYGINAIGYDISDSQFNSNGLIKQDITDNRFKIPKSDICASVFTLQFIQKEDRQNVVNKIYDSLRIGGFFIVCEKEYQNYSQVNDIMTFSNFDNKRSTFTCEEIMDKEQSIRGIMKLNTGKENYDLLLSAGFKIVEPFFQSLQFRGYICIK